LLFDRGWQNKICYPAIGSALGLLKCRAVGVHGRLDVSVPHEALLHPERRADIINQRSIGVPKAVPPHSLQPNPFTCWSQVVLLNGIAMDRAFRIRISE
jgi:hypothetical protein